MAEMMADLKAVKWVASLEFWKVEKLVDYLVGKMGNHLVAC